MRIAFISYEFPPDTGKGGIGTYIAQIATALAQIGWDIYVFAGSNKRTISEKTDNYRVHRIQCENSTDFRIKVVKPFEEQHAIANFNIIECPEIGGNAWEIKKKIPGIPLVVRLHAPDYLVEHLKKRYIPVTSKLRFVLGALRRFKWDLGYWRVYNKTEDTDYQFIHLANYITAPSQAMKDWAVKHWEINPENIEVIPNIFLPAEGFLQIPIAEKAVGNSIVFFGRLNVLKGLVNGTKAIKRILKEYPHWQFRVIGDDGNGPYSGIGMRDWMKGQLKQSLNRVEFLDGMVYEALPGAIQKSEIVLLPSLFESFSYTCIEAMAAGKAVVGSKSGGMADLIRHNETGLLIDPESTGEIHKALKRLIDNNALRYKLSIKAREAVLKDFDVNVTVQHFNNYYRHAIASSN